MAKSLLVGQHVQRHYTAWGSENHRQVYNVTIDPSESQNVLAERPDVYERLQTLLNISRRDGSSKGFEVKRESL